MSHAAPVIDVVIPTFNAESTLQSAIASIQQQTIDDIRIIVVDDGSTDRSGEMLAGIAAQDRRVRIVSTANGGIVDALNTGLGNAAAEFVARFDSDDIAFPDRLSRQLDFLRRNDRHVAVGGNAWHIGPDGARLGTRSHFGGDVAPDPRAAPSKEPYIMHPFLLARRDAIERAGGYRYVFHAEDTDLYWRLLHVGRLHNLSDMLGEYRLHPGSVTGASVVNGRISAVYSQLAAVSFLRVENGKADLIFEKAMLALCQQSWHVEAMLALWAPHLAAGERYYMRLSVAAKLMELAAYRPYELEEDDCRFIFRALVRQAWRRPPMNIARIGAKWLRTSERLRKGGRWRELRALAGLR